MRERKKEDAVIPAGVLMIDVKQVAAKCGLGVSTCLLYTSPSPRDTR